MDDMICTYKIFEDVHTCLRTKKSDEIAKKKEVNIKVLFKREG